MESRQVGRLRKLLKLPSRSTSWRGGHKMFKNRYSRSETLVRRRAHLSGTRSRKCQWSILERRRRSSQSDSQPRGWGNTRFHTDEVGSQVHGTTARPERRYHQRDTTEGELVRENRGSQYCHQCCSSKSGTG